MTFFWEYRRRRESVHRIVSCSSGTIIESRYLSANRVYRLYLDDVRSISLTARSKILINLRIFRLHGRTEPCRVNEGHPLRSIQSQWTRIEAKKSVPYRSERDHPPGNSILCVYSRGEQRGRCLSLWGDALFSILILQIMAASTNEWHFSIMSTIILPMSILSSSGKTLRLFKKSPTSWG